MLSMWRTYSERLSEYLCNVIESYERVCVCQVKVTTLQQRHCNVINRPNTYILRHISHISIHMHACMHWRACACRVVESR